MKPYMLVLLSAFVAPCYAVQSDNPRSENTLGRSVGATQQIPQHAQISKESDMHYDVPCFSLYSATRVPGANCVPDY